MRWCAPVAAAWAGELSMGVGDQRFALGVECAGGFVEQQDRAVGEDGAGDGDALALAARRRTPRSPSSVSKPFGSALANSVTWAASQAARTSASLASGCRSAHCR